MVKYSQKCYFDLRFIFESKVIKVTRQSTERIRFKLKREKNVLNWAWHHDLSNNLFEKNFKKI